MAQNGVGDVAERDSGLRRRRFVAVSATTAAIATASVQLGFYFDGRLNGNAQRRGSRASTSRSCRRRRWLVFASISSSSRRFESTCWRNFPLHCLTVCLFVSLSLFVQSCLSQPWCFTCAQSTRKTTTTRTTQLKLAHTYVHNKRRGTRSAHILVEFVFVLVWFQIICFFLLLKICTRHVLSHTHTHTCNSTTIRSTKFYTKKQLHQLC